MNKEFFNDKTVLIMGLGKFGGGVDSAIFAAKNAQHVIVTDLADEKTLADPLTKLNEYTNIEYRLDGHHKKDFISADIIIENPAIDPANNKYLQIARENNKTITSQIEIFFQLCSAKIIGITGANGKSTTASLTAALLEAGIDQEDTAYSNVYLSGNIGNRPLLEELANIQPSDLIVLELSSFQLQQLQRIQAAPNVSVITNLTENHLDRHGTFEEYCNAKENIFKYQKLDKDHPAISIFNAADPITSKWYDRYKIQPGRKCFAYRAEDVPKDFVNSFPLAGKANISNLAAALTVAHHFGVNDERLGRAIANFKPLPNRLEQVAEIAGVRWYDDSISTTPQSTIAALDAFAEPKILIAGGYDKNLPFDELGLTIAKKAKAVVLIGNTAEKIADTIQPIPDSSVYIRFADSMKEAVDLAAEIAISGDVVLLSPACASYDMFENYRHRAEVFCQQVNSLRQ